MIKVPAVIVIAEAKQFFQFMVRHDASIYKWCYGKELPEEYKKGWTKEQYENAWRKNE